MAGSDAPGAKEPVSGAERFAAALAALQMDKRVVRFDETTRTAAEAAAAIGCTVSQIAKSLVFKTARTEQPVLVIASGTNRVDEKRVAAVLAGTIDGQAIHRPDAAFVRDRTGYAIGGVAPIGHTEPPVVVIDADLFGHAAIWAAAGTPNTVFELTPVQLLEMTGGAKAEIARRK
jgi:prolyl-tRNA editing enzyme YbaK/EbsC (Cys-tRNA(Pro) deacylase)